MSADRNPGGPTAGGPDARPVLRLVHGDATAEEVAALLAAISALTSAGATHPPVRPPSGWTDRSRTLGRPPRPGPGAWRTSAWPR